MGTSMAKTGIYFLLRYQPNVSFDSQPLLLWPLPIE